MNIRAQSDVVSDVPARMVRIVVKDDVVVVPVPVSYIAEIERGNAEIKSAKPEAAGAASGKTPASFTANWTGETTVLPRMIKVKPGVVVTEIVSDPLSVMVDVGSFRMSLLIAERALGLVVRRAFIGWRSATRYVAMSDLVTSTTSSLFPAVTFVLC